MVNETSIREKLEAIVHEFDGVEDIELPARLARVLSFAKSSVYTVAHEEPDTAEGICARIDRLRDQRIDGGFTWRDMQFQSRQSDRENIIGAAHLASLFIAAGGDPSSLRWANPDSDFEWILADNGRTPLSAMDVIDLMQAGVAFKAAQTFYARALKDAVVSAEDPTSVNIVDGWPD